MNESTTEHYTISTSGCGSVVCQRETGRKVLGRDDNENIHD